MPKIVEAPLISDESIKFLPSRVFGFGAFGLYREESVEPIWRSCREEFSRFWKSPATLLFSIGDQGCGIDNIANFIRHFEQIMTIYGPPTDEDFSFTTFSKTNMSWAIAVNPSKFWSECSVRRSLFTILLRCGKAYTSPSSFDNALLSDESRYAQSTKDAILRFLSGNCVFQPINGEDSPGEGSFGWVGYYSYTDPKVRTMQEKAIATLKRHPKANQLPELAFNTVIA